MLANKHRRHIISNRLALATGFVLLLAQTSQHSPIQKYVGANNAKTVIAEVSADSKQRNHSVLLDLGLLLLGR